MTNCQNNQNDMDPQNTPEKEQEEHLHHLSSIVEQAREPVVETDLQFRIVYMNRAAEVLTGYSLEEVRGKEPGLLGAHPEDRSFHDDIYAKITQGELEDVEFLNKRKNGELYWVQVTLTPLWTASKTLKGYVSFYRDITERKQSEELLKASENNFRAFFETMDDMLFIGNREGTIFHANPGATKKLGYSLEELKKMHILELHPQRVRGEAEKIFRDMFAGTRDNCPLPLQKKDGTLLPVETRIWFGTWNGKEALFGISKDLSREQEALQKFNKLFESNPIPMALSILPERSFSEVNQAFLDYTGYTKEEVLGKNSADFHIFPEREQQRRVAEKLLEKGFIRHEELGLITKSGERKEGLFSGEILESQGKQYFLTMMVDITERKRAERELELQFAMQKVLIHIAKECINMPIQKMEETVTQSLGEISRFVGADRAYVFSYDWHKKTCSNLYEWCAPGISPQKQTLQGVPLKHIPWWAEAHRNGETLYVPRVASLPENDGVRQILELQEIQSLIAVPMMEEGDCIGFLGFDSVNAPHTYTEREKVLLEIFAEIMVNLRTRKTLEENLTKEKEHAQAANRAKSEFLANMSHEIRTPLNGVIGFTDLLMDTPLSPAQERFVHNVNTSGHTLLEIISDILDFSKIEAGRLELEVVKTDIPELVEESLTLVRYGADQKGLKMLVEVDSAMPRYLFGDPVRLKQVLTNLLSNAVKFTEEGTVLLKIDFSPRNFGRGLFSFSVEDTGIGISEEDRQKLFRAFSQGDSSTTRKFGGTGLGLIISQKLVQKMGGTITLKSSPGKGSVFSFAIETACEKEPGNNAP